MNAAEMVTESVGGVIRTPCRVIEVRYGLETFLAPFTDGDSEVVSHDAILIQIK